MNTWYLSESILTSWYCQKTDISETEKKSLSNLQEPNRKLGKQKNTNYR